FEVEPSASKNGHTIVIRQGERIPVDAVVTSGTTSIDTKALTGESIPENVWPGEKIYSGCINLSAAIEAKVTALYVDSTVSRIMEMVEDAQNQKAESETFVTRFSRAYVPIDRKSTRLNSSHVSISYAVFCLKKKKIK